MSRQSRARLVLLAVYIAAMIGGGLVVIYINPIVSIANIAASWIIIDWALNALKEGTQ